MKKCISVRFEGGIGDHILGMRILRFIHQRYPCHKIIGFSDAGGHESQLEVSRMSPHLAEVIPVYHKKNHPKFEAWGRLNNIQRKYINWMFSANLFFDTWGDSFFIEQSKALNVSFYEILANRPKLLIPKDYNKKATAILNQYKNCTFIGLNLSKYELAFFQKNKNIILIFLKELLKNKNVIILNFFTSSYQFPHWPKVLGAERERLAQKEYRSIGELWNIDRRIVPFVDLPISMVAAFLKKCSYFIGVDNGIKHLAWALNIPYIYFVSSPPKRSFILRWMPDFHRCLLFRCTKRDFLTHMSVAKQLIKSPTYQKTIPK